MLVILQIAVSCMILPMMILGVMVGLSGGGATPAFQRIGSLMMTLAPLIGIIGVVVSFISRRADLDLLAYAALAVPVIVWIGLLIWLQHETGFFS